MGVNSLSLLDENGNWVDRLDVMLFPYNAGTEEGADFASTDIPSIPPQPIFSLESNPLFTSSPLVGSGFPPAALSIERIIPES